MAGAWYTKQEGDTADALGLEDEPTRSASCELAEIEPLHYLRAAIGCRLSGAHRPVRAPSSRCRTGHYSAALTCVGLFHESPCRNQHEVRS